MAGNDELQDDAVSLVGLPANGKAPAIRVVLRHSARGLAGTLFATIAAWLPFGVVVALGPVLAQHLEVPDSAVVDVALQILLLAALTAAGSALLIAARPALRRPMIATSAIGGIGLLLGAGGSGGQGSIALAGAIGMGLSVPVLRPTAVESTIVGGRNRTVNALHLGAVLGIAIPAVLANGAGVDVVLSVSGFIAIALAFFGVALVKPPAPGWHDEVQVRRLIHDDAAMTERRWGAREALRRVWARPTLRRGLAPIAILGLGILPMPVIGWYLATDRAGVTLADRGNITLGSVAIAVAFALLSGIGSDHRFARDGALPLRRASMLVAVAGLLAIVAALSSNQLAILLAVGSSAGTVAVVLARYDVAIATGMPSGIRPHALAMISAASWLGAVFGLAVIAAVDSRFGPAWAMGVMGVAMINAAILVVRSSQTVTADVEQTVDRLIGFEQLANRRRAGEKIPLLQASNIDFAYGQVQVLFGVDFTVDEGEMVALLGTNGAGKSTLLRVLSGLGTPARGSVRYDGQDVTFWLPTQRVAAGITQVPGGKAVFAPMTVIENLRVYGYALGRDRAAVGGGRAPG
ncbi:MAG: hypothetical protein ACI867_001908, partial [Glaciecola sp.]